MNHVREARKNFRNEKYVKRRQAAKKLARERIRKNRIPLSALFPQYLAQHCTNEYKLVPVAGTIHDVYAGVSYEEDYGCCKDYDFFAHQTCHGRQSRPQKQHILRARRVHRRVHLEGKVITLRKLRERARHQSKVLTDSRMYKICQQSEGVGEIVSKEAYHENQEIDYYSQDRRFCCSLKETCEDDSTVAPDQTGSEYDSTADEFFNEWDFCAESEVESDCQYSDYAPEYEKEAKSKQRNQPHRNDCIDIHQHIPRRKRRYTWIDSPFV
jgi:hypothetical protein